MKYYSSVSTHARLPKLTITEQQVQEAYGNHHGMKSIAFYANSEWSRMFEQFYKERIIHVRIINVLLLRFDYDYEIDLDRIQSERDLLNWTYHLVNKPWMGPERTKQFIKAVADIKGFNLHLD